MKNGVYYSKLLVDFSNIEKLIREIATNPKIPSSESKALTMIADDIKDEDDFSLDTITKQFNKALAHFVRLKECPKEVFEYLFDPKVPRRILGHFGVDERLGIFSSAAFRRRWEGVFRGQLRYPIFQPRILTDINDVIIVEVQETTGKNKILFEITTITEEGELRFRNFLKCIPHIGNSVKEVRNRKTFSSRYAFRPYPLAVRLWLKNEKAVTVPEDLKDFLKGSTRYYSEAEWRTSIVLSAIGVESVLADLYEEKFKEYAPNVPLGQLYNEVKSKIKFPSDIAGAIEMANEARISAVHRSRFQVSDREAIKALYGSTTFIMWYSSNY